MDRVFRLAAEPLREIAFFKYVLPFIMVAGIAAFFYYGWTGIVHKKTIGLSRRPGATGPPLQIDGNFARVAGVIYVVCGMVLSGFFVGMVYYLHF